ncbi:hypothetical protein CAEBREN_17076 [Caenorhabditis brenneri]|uniref:Uncharacterized protein n=1 Tax=Caenorhabditis brenneri TaxID=135651 RepID=G0P1V7_CAEBE|nr:hypothetical protein CAEBREN_17076 [Caenorhabditis brenneri]
MITNKKKGEKRQTTQ